jgi:hypothetical protein
MPDVIDKDLRDCLERANPYTEYIGSRSRSRM